MSIVQTNLFRPSSSHSAVESYSFQFTVKIFSQSALAWEPENIFSTGPELALGGLVDLCPIFNSNLETVNLGRNTCYFGPVYILSYMYYDTDNVTVAAEDDVR